jgi:hypothetical protein
LDAYEARVPIHAPEMTYLDNYLSLQHADSGLTLEFSTERALLRCFNKHEAQLKVSDARTWMQRSATSNPEIAVKKEVFDWTYTSNYQGSYGVSDTKSTPESKDLALNTFPTVTFPVDAAEENTTPFNIPAADVLVEALQTQSTDEKMPVQLLMDRSYPILFQDNIRFYDDELHDNGVSSFSAKIRVHSYGFLVLLRFWLRVDGVILRVYDTRIFHKFGQPHLLVDRVERAVKFADLTSLRLPQSISAYNDPNKFANRLPISKHVTSKLVIPTTTTTTTTTA